MPRKYLHKRPTFGVLAGWQFYRTATTLSYLGPVFRGITRAAQDLNCNLLLGCGMGPSASLNDPPRPVWPTLSPDEDFAPIGPWNTDGIIVINPLHSTARLDYLKSLIADSHPVLFIGSGPLGPAIVADNAGGTLEAMRHLIAHGHRRIAFIAGSQEDMDGDTGIRLRAYQEACEAYGLETDERLVCYGRHVYDGGRVAMRTMLDSGAEFTAVLSSNDESAIGAMQVLKEAGYRIPQDVAIIGFDDRPESVVQEPSLSSLRIPLFNMGYQAVELMVQNLSAPSKIVEKVSITTRLVARESCGCERKKRIVNVGELPKTADSPDLASWGLQVAQTIGALVFGQAQSLGDNECQTLASRLVDSFLESVARNELAAFQKTLDAVLHETVAGGDDAHVWQDSISLLTKDKLWLSSLSTTNPHAADLVDQLVDEARQAISLRMQRQHRQHVVDQRWTTSRLSLLTAKLLNALDETQVYQILAEHLPDMGIQTALVVLFEREDDDPVAWSIARNVIHPDQPSARFRSRSFPPDKLFEPQQLFQLALAPLVTQYGQVGYVVFDTGSLDLYGAIVQQLSSALNTAMLYREAIEGRRLAEEANLMKSRFLSTVSHELRSPLNLIVGLSGMLLQDSNKSADVLPESSRKEVERVHAQAQHLSGLIGDVLDLASSDLGQLRLTTESIDLSQALHIVAETGRQLAAEKGLRWNAVLPESGPWVWGDRTRLRQVALNLISNAVKFTAHGEVTLELQTAQESVTITVRDTGLGIPPNEQQAIFNEFRQSERTVSRGYGGLGLGLAICKRLIEMQGGTIGVRSTGEEGAGSSFFFTLPIVQPALVELPRPTHLPLANQNVLLLTTPDGASERLRDHLAEHGLDVQTVFMDELEKLESQAVVSPPDALVLDVSVPSDLVWSVLKTTLGNPLMQGIPVLFYASSQDSGSVLELDYMTKPIRVDELKRVLDRQWSAGETAGTRTFLVVDDEPNTLEMNARIVQSHSPTSHILKARDGCEALEILRHSVVDLVMLDLMMPEMDGFGVLEAMRAQDTTRDIPVIVLTGKLLTEADMARLNRGVARVLGKGLFTVDETLAHVSAALEHKRRLSTEAQRLVRRAMAYLHEHYDEPVSRRDIALHVGMAEDHLTHCFRQELGTTPIAYLNRYRINQAKRLLKESEQNITEIAFAVGFSDSGYFSRVFRRETGISPEAFRRA